MKKSATRSTPSATRQKPPGRRQEEILEKAVELFARHGYSATDTQRLADELQVGKGTLYRYFPSKESLFLAAVDFCMRKLHEQVAAFVAEVADPMDRIREGIRAYLAFFVEHPEFVELMIQERALFKDQQPVNVFRAAGGICRAVAGPLPPDDRRRADSRRAARADHQRHAATCSTGPCSRTSFSAGGTISRPRRPRSWTLSSRVC